MHFQLPTNLQQELLAYDPKLKALVQESKPKSKTKKAKYPLGNVIDLIPTDVIRESLMRDAVDLVNANPAKHRHHSFTKPVDVATPQARVITTAILYHYEQTWHAAWLPPEHKKDDYVYGYSIAFKDTATAGKIVPRNFWNYREDYERKQYGRSWFYVITKFVTKQEIIDGYNDYRWKAPHLASYYDKAREIHTVVQNFQKSLVETIPYWQDSSNIFERIKCNSVGTVLDLQNKVLEKMDTNDRDFTLTFDNLMQYCTTVEQEFAGYYLSEYRVISEQKEILSKPFFKRWIQQQLDDVIHRFNDSGNNYRHTIQRGLSRIQLLAMRIDQVLTIWPDCPLDYIQNYLDILLCTYLPTLRKDNKNAEWLRQHMPVASFFKLIEKNYIEKQEEIQKNPLQSYSYERKYDLNIHRFFEWNDTVSMIGNVLDANKELTPPRRWRINELHDHVQAEAWKIRNAKESLHQDLFPQPIKVNINDTNWTFFQPSDTHQLAQWGQAVRNCVGSASQYANDIRKRKHFIVLAMLDGRPMFTIQLYVDMGVMNVRQIAGIGNERLNDDQRDEYTKAFQQALQLRESELKS